MHHSCVVMGSMPKTPALKLCTQAIPDPCSTCNENHMPCVPSLQAKLQLRCLAHGS